MRPVALLLSPGQAGDNPRLVPLLESLAQAMAKLRHPGRSQTLRGYLD